VYDERRATLDGKLLLSVLPPCRPFRQNPPIATRATPMMNVEDEINERVRVVHPAQIQDHSRVEVAKTILQEGLNNTVLLRPSLRHASRTSFEAKLLSVIVTQM
jgi:hypothetical protein